jgi:hypothetical protein
MDTTSHEVISTFAVTDRARALPRRWQEDPARPQVAPTVLRHVTCVLYELEPSQVEAACSASEHPLGDIRKHVAMSVQPVVDSVADRRRVLLVRLRGLHHRGAAGRRPRRARASHG